MTIFSGIAQANASRSAGRESANASNSAAILQAQQAAAATDEQRRQYNQTREDMQPWLESGRSALGVLDRTAAGDMSGFMASPDYSFKRSEGQRDIGSSFAARGGAASGNALRALNEFNSNLASGEFGNWWNRTASRAGVGQSTAGTLGSLGQSTANSISDIATGAGRGIGQSLQSAGNARASGILGAGQANANTIQNTARLASYFYGGFGGF